MSQNPSPIEPVCSCKTVLGNVYPIFRSVYIERKNKLLQDKNISPGGFINITDSEVIMKDILNDLKIYRICCRTRMMGHYL